MRFTVNCNLIIRRIIMSGPRYDNSQPPPYNPDALHSVYTLAEAKASGLTAAPRVEKAVNEMKSDAYAAQMGNSSIDYFAGLQDVFERNEILLGLIDKVLGLKNHAFHFKIDDSGSMREPSSNPPLSRWQDAEARLHAIIDILSYVPTRKITLSYLNSQHRIVLDRTGKTPQEFVAYAHKQIQQLFLRQPSGTTPILENIKQMIDESDGDTMNYILTDGEPSGGAEEIRQIKDVLFQRPNPASTPFTFLSLSNLLVDRRWMHEIEEEAENKYFVAAVPDYEDEKQEVIRNQGAFFAYPKGLWLICNIAAAKNPYDLDALDQHAPLTKLTLEGIFGVQYTDEYYRRYFDQHPNAKRVFAADFDLFLRKEVAFQIPSVKLFDDVLAEALKKDMDNDDDNSEDRETQYAEQVVLQYFRNRRQMPRVSELGNWGVARNDREFRGGVEANDKVEECCRCSLM